MADVILPSFGAQPGVQAAFPATQKVILETEFRRRLRDFSLIDKITSHNWKGRFKNSGVQIRRPVLPILKSHRRNPGDPIQYQDLQGKEEIFTISREREIAYHVRVEDEMFSPQNLDSKVNKEAQAQYAEDVDTEFLTDIPFKCHALNCGNEAGVKSGMYDLGSTDAPLKLCKLDSDVGTTEHAITATEFVTNCAAALEEWPGGKQGEIKVIVPTWVQKLLINSELKHADEMGDQTSVLRKGIDYIGTISGADIIGCNNLPMWAATDELPKRFLCFFLNTAAIEYVDEISMEDTLTDKDQYGKFHRTLGIYDWFASYPELMGYAVVSAK